MGGDALISINEVVEARASPTRALRQS
jgi:hypothetical protein